MADIAVSYDRFRPKVCAFFAGRAWYAGVPSGEKLGWILFSQVLDDITNISKCHQQNDPTSEVFSDIKDTDGGVMQIPEIGDINGIVPVGKALLVFGSNGVWQIIGGENGFTASSFSIEKISASGCVSQKSVIIVEESVFYWGFNGIYVVTPDPSGYNFAVKNISDKTIKTLYQNIPTVNKVYADGKYNSTTKIVHWLYSDSDDLINSNGLYVKTSVLVFDLQLGCFYTYSLDDTTGPLVVSLAVTKETTAEDIDVDVVVGTDSVLSGTDDVVISYPIINSSVKQFKYFTLVPDPVPAQGAFLITFSDYNHTYFSDWYAYDDEGAEKPSYAITGYNTGGVGPARSKTSAYVHMFMRRTETELDEDTQPVNPSGIKMQTRWDFTDNAYPGKWSDEVQVYRQLRPYWGTPSTNFEDGYPLVITKNKIRGRGKAMQIKLSAEEGKDMQIIGWSTGFVGNTNV